VLYAKIGPAVPGWIPSAERDDPTCAFKQPQLLEVFEGTAVLCQSSIDLSFARRRTPGDKGAVMSRKLPPHPNLEHLKKQAKDLLKDLKQQNPASQLADAQHSLAREYGFASWPKLKAYVESLPQPVEPLELQAVVAFKKPNPFAGKWIANLAKSKRHPGRQFQSAMMEFNIEGDNVTVTDIVVEESGEQSKSQSTILVDGNEHLLENGNGNAFTAKWRGPHTFEVVAKKDGEVVGWGIYETSNDGKILTITSDEQQIVLERV
jgi:hypothetical protein